MLAFQSRQQCPPIVSGLHRDHLSSIHDCGAIQSESHESESRSFAVARSSGSHCSILRANRRKSLRSSSFSAVTVSSSVLLAVWEISALLSCPTWWYGQLAYRCHNYATVHTISIKVSVRVLASLDKLFRRWSEVVRHLLKMFPLGVL